MAGLFLRRRGAAYRFRARVPVDLVPHLGRVEVGRSLGTTERKEARRLALAMGARVDAAWYRLRAMVQQSSESDDVRERLLAELERVLALTDEVEGVEARRDVLARDLDRLRGLTDGIEQSRGTIEATKAATERLATVRRRIEQARQAGELDGAPLAALQKLLDGSGVVMRDRPTPTILRFLEDTFIPERNLQEDANRHVQGYVRLFAKAVGDRPMNAYTRADIVKWVRTLEKVRTSYGKGGKDAHKPIETILRESRGKPTLGRTTIEKHVTHLRQVFSLAARHHRFATSDDVEGMFADVRLGRAVPPPERRRLWPLSDLSALFRSPVWAGTRARREDFTHRHQEGPHVHLDAYWWLPVIGIHTGMRLEEIAQLRHDDLAQDGDGRPFLRVTDTGEGQRLKTESSRRAVPVHPFLAGVGFMRLFVQGRRGWVFPELKPAGRPPKRGGQYSEDFTAYRREVGVYEPLKDFHSFRHTLVSALREAGADPGVVAFLVGHRSDPDYVRWEQTDQYTTFSVKAYAAAMERLDWEKLGVDLSRIRAAVLLVGVPRGTLRAEDVERRAAELRGA